MDENERDTFTCTWCRNVAHFPGARVGGFGHACSSKCYEAALYAYWRACEPDKYGTITEIERQWCLRNGVAMAVGGPYGKEDDDT